MDPTHPEVIAAASVEGAGKVLFGEHWISQLAAALNVNERTIQRIAAAARAREGYPAARNLIEPIQHLVTARAIELVSEADRLNSQRGAMALPPARCATIPRAEFSEIVRPPNPSLGVTWLGDAALIDIAHIARMLHGVYQRRRAASGATVQDWDHEPSRRVWLERASGMLTDVVVAEVGDAPGGIRTLSAEDVFGKCFNRALDAFEPA